MSEPGISFDRGAQIGELDEAERTATGLFSLSAGKTIFFDDQKAWQVRTFMD
jgi:hypothetical protein